MRVHKLPLAVFLVFQLSIINCQLSIAQDTSICYLRDDNGKIREHNVDFLKMNLDVKFNTQEGKIFGTVKYDFRPIQYVVDTLFLNAPAIKIKTVLLNGKETKFTTDSLGLTVHFLPALNWNKQYNLEINYEASPRKGLYFIGWNVDEFIADSINKGVKDRYYTRKQIWTQGQGIDNRHWIPCYDDVNDKMITETTITFDSAYTVISNGALKEKKKNVDGTTTWHYAMSKPMAPYLIMIGIDKYAYKDYKSKNGMVSRQYYYADHPETAEPTYDYSAEMMDWLCNETGIFYPWGTYCNVPVQDFMFGAMENTSATIYGDFYLNDTRSAVERNYVGTNAHELTHQWFGDYITEFSATHHWLHESFATYYSKQFIHHILGEDRYEWDRRMEQNNAMNADRINRFSVAHSMGGSNRHYPKGSAVIDMIRYVVGDSVYKKCITNYLRKHAYSNVLTSDFKMVFMETAGINLDWFFDEWVTRAGFPEYVVSYEKQKDRVAIFVAQKQKVDELTGYFKMPIVFEVHYKNGTSSTVKEWLSHAADTVYVNTTSSSQIDYVLFDPGSNLIKKVEFKKSFEELSSQLLNANHFIDRFDALRALLDTSIERKRDLLVAVFAKNNFQTLKADIVLQLSKDSSTAAINLFRNALQDKDMMVRRSVLDHLDTFPLSIVTDVEKILSDTSYINIETALRKLCKQFPEKTERYLAQTKNLYGINDNVRAAWLEMKIKYGTNGIEEAKKELTYYTSNHFEFRTRVRAVDAIERLEFCNEEIIKNLFNACTNANSRLANPASRCLKTLFKNSSTLEKAKGIFKLNSYKDWEKKIIEKTLQ